LDRAPIFNQGLRNPDQLRYALWHTILGGKTKHVKQKICR
jgi:hypothetical protein